MVSKEVTDVPLLVLTLVKCAAYQVIHFSMATSCYFVIGIPSELISV